MTGTILWQRVEGALVFAAGLALFAASPAELSWGWALALFFAPDLSFAAYAIGPRAGAAAYNFSPDALKGAWKRRWLRRLAGAADARPQRGAAGSSPRCRRTRASMCSRGRTCASGSCGCARAA